MGGQLGAGELEAHDSVGALLDQLRLQGPATRRELADRTGLSIAMLGSRIAPLIEAGYVIERRGLSTGGRPAGRLAFNPNAGVVLVAELGRTHSRLAVSDLDGNPLAERPGERSLSEGPDAILGWALDSFAELLAEANRGAADVRGIGIGMPGPVEYGAGRVVDPPALPGWHGVDIPAALQPHYDVPVVVDNDANAEAIGEHWTNWRDTVDDLLYVKCGTGIGCGIVLSGRIHRGAEGASGEIGHIPVSGAEGLVCRCGNTGCLETVASGRALADELSTPERPVANGREVVELLLAGDPDAARLVRAAGRALGEVLGSAVTLLNPSVLVLGGDLAPAGDVLLTGIREVIYQRATVLASRSLQITTSSLADRSGIVGAAVTVLDVILAASEIDRTFAAQTEALA